MTEFDTLNDLVRVAERTEVAKMTDCESPQGSEAAVGNAGRFTELPENGDFVNHDALPEDAPAEASTAVAAPQPQEATELVASQWAEEATQEEAPGWDDGETEWVKLVNRAQQKEPQDPVDVIRALLGRETVNLGALAKPGRKNVFDDYMRGRLVSLLGLGLSLRQAGAALNVSHMGIWKALKRDPELQEEVNKARFRAQIEPLTVIIRASKHDWHAATWLVKHLQGCPTAREEVPTEE